MRISDWSSDVCSSDLNGEGAAAYAGAARQTAYIEAATISAINECFPPVASDRLYLDHAATTPILPQAKAAMAEALESWSNRSEEHTSELQSLMRISYAVFCLKKKKKSNTNQQSNTNCEYTS